MSRAHQPALEPPEPETRVIGVEVRQPRENRIEIGAGDRENGLSS